MYIAQKERRFLKGCVSLCCNNMTTVDKYSLQLWYFLHNILYREIYVHLCKWDRVKIKLTRIYGTNIFWQQKSVKCRQTHYIGKSFVTTVYGCDDEKNCLKQL